MTQVVSKYNVELRNKDGYLVTYLTPFVSKLTWEWRRLGGCGRCNISLAIDHRKIEFDAGADIQIRIKSGSTSKLVYRGWIAKVIPSMKIGGDVKLDVRGYFDKFEKIIVQDSGDDKIYTAESILNIVDDIADTYILPNTDITKGTIDAGAFTPDEIKFKTTVKSALRTLADIEGQLEYGVDENLQFFWTYESSVLVRKWFVGDKVTNFERRINWDNLLNKIYFEGGDVDGEKFLKTAEAADSQTQFFVVEGIESNSSIVTGSVADQYLSSILKDRSKPQLEMKVKIVETDVRLEDNIPIGRIAIVDSEYDSSVNIWGKTANGGSNLIWGKIASGGSSAIWGGTYSDQIDTIKYSLSDTDGKFNIDINFGGTISESSAKLKQIESVLNSLRQR